MRKIGGGDQLEAREAIFGLCKLLRALPVFDETGGQKRLTNSDIVAGILDTKGRQAPASIIQEVRKGNGKRYIPLLHKSISSLIDKYDVSDSYVNVEFERLSIALDPYQASQLSADFVKRKIRSAKKRVYIFNNFIPDIEEFAHLLNRVPDVRLILMAPNSRYLEERANEIGQSLSEFHSILSRQLEHIRETITIKSALRLYSGLPSNPFYIFDDDIYCGFFLHKRLAAKSPHRLFKANTADGELLEQEFEEIWAKSHELKAIRLPVALPRKAQALIDIIPSARGAMSIGKLEDNSDQMKGQYIFARYRSSAIDKSSEDYKEPIVIGEVELLPYDLNEGVLRFKAALPNKKGSKKLTWSEFSGVFIPFKKFVILIGDHSSEKAPSNSDGKPNSSSKANKLPVVMILQRFEKGEKKLQKNPPQGLVLRRHPNGQIISSRVVLLSKKAAHLDPGRGHIEARGTHLSERDFVMKYADGNGKILNLLKSDINDPLSKFGVMRMEENDALK